MILSQFKRQDRHFYYSATVISSYKQRSQIINHYQPGHNIIMPLQQTTVGV
ncbi:hypothetical protein [Cyanothece sp. BG0011]|uniref:hypothetical protein n=1 Tax=Cyanothece sp. BG0011 TaxID=2082950 RepID=UPI0030DA0861